METSGARICLTKRIPSRAGLGGGSADCAETLKALNHLWNLNFPMETLLELGAKLGADVPFCLTGGTGARFRRRRTNRALAQPAALRAGADHSGRRFIHTGSLPSLRRNGKARGRFWGKHAENAVKYSPENPTSESCMAEYSPEALARGNCAATEHSPLRLAEVLLAGDYALAERLSFNALEAPAIRLLPEIGKWINRFRELARALRPHDRQRFNGFRRF